MQALKTGVCHYVRLLVTLELIILDFHMKLLLKTTVFENPKKSLTKIVKMVKLKLTVKQFNQTLKGQKLVENAMRHFGQFSSHVDTYKK